MSNPELTAHLSGQTDPQTHTPALLADTTPQPEQGWRPAEVTPAMQRIAAGYRLAAEQQPEQEQDAAAMSAFAQAMSVKLTRAREKGRGGWQSPEVCSVTWLWDQMQEHARKANLDMVDVANFAMMINWRCANVPGDKELLAAHVATPQPEQELSTEQVRALLEDRVEAWQERVDYLRDFERGATTEDDRRRCQARADVAADALMDFRRLRKIEREAHATTRTELDRLRAALAEAEALADRLERQIGECEAEANHQQLNSRTQVHFAAMAEADRDTLRDLRQALGGGEGEKGGA